MIIVLKMLHIFVCVYHIHAKDTQMYTQYAKNDNGWFSTNDAEYLKPLSIYNYVLITSAWKKYNAVNFQVVI